MKMWLAIIAVFAIGAVIHYVFGPVITIVVFFGSLVVMYQYTKNDDKKDEG